MSARPTVARATTRPASAPARLRTWTLRTVALAAALTAALVVLLWRSLGLSVFPEWVDFSLYLLLFLSPYALLATASLLLSRRKLPAALLLVVSVLAGLWGLGVLALGLSDPNAIVRVILSLSALLPQWIGGGAAALVALLLGGRKPADGDERTGSAAQG